MPSIALLRSVLLSTADDDDADADALIDRALRLQ